MNLTDKNNWKARTFLFLIVLTFTIGLSSAETFGYGKTEEVPINWSLIPTVNDSNCWLGHCTNDASWLTGYLGSNIVWDSDVNMNGYNLFLSQLRVAQNGDIGFWDGISDYDFNINDGAGLYCVKITGGNVQCWDGTKVIFYQNIDMPNNNVTAKFVNITGGLISPDNRLNIQGGGADGFYNIVNTTGYKNIQFGGAMLNVAGVYPIVGWRTAVLRGASFLNEAFRLDPQTGHITTIGNVISSLGYLKGNYFQTNSGGYYGTSNMGLYDITDGGAFTMILGDSFEGMNIWSDYVMNIFSSSGINLFGSVTTGMLTPYSAGVFDIGSASSPYRNLTISGKFSDNNDIWRIGATGDGLFNIVDTAGNKTVQFGRTQFNAFQDYNITGYSIGQPRNSVINPNLLTFLINPKTGNAYFKGNMNITGNLSVKRPYGMFSSNQTQVITAPNTAQVINWTHTEDAYLIYDGNGENFTIGQTGDYKIDLSAIASVDLPNKHVEIWVQKFNGSVWANVPRSNTKVEITSASTETLIVVPFIIDYHIGEKFRLMMASDDAGSSLVYTTNTSYSPETPSIIMTIHKISELTD